jgi:hypothetical protein
MAKYNFKSTQCISWSLQGGLTTNPWRGPCDTWCYLLLDLAKSKADGGAHRSHPRGMEHGKRTWGKHHMRNFIISKIQWMIVYFKRSKKERLNIEMKVWIFTYNELFWGPPFLQIVAPMFCYDKYHPWAWTLEEKKSPKHQVSSGKYIPPMSLSHGPLLLWAWGQRLW